MAEYHLWDVLDELRSPNYAWVDLTHSLDNNSPVWSGIPAGSVELAKTVYDWGNEMLDCLIQTFKFPGQFGTHIDFPGHFVRDAALSEKYGVHSMLYPLCVIDITGKVKADPHYAVTIQDILDYETRYGAKFVAVRAKASKPAFEQIWRGDGAPMVMVVVFTVKVTFLTGDL